MRAATKLRAEQIKSIAYVDNELPEAPAAPAHPDQGLPPEPGHPDQGPVRPPAALPPHPTRPYPGIEGAVIVLETTYGEIVVVARDGLTYAKRVADREQAQPKVGGSMTAAGQPVYPAAGGGSLGQAATLPADNKIQETDWVVTDYSIEADKEIVRIIDDQTFTKHFKISLSG